MADGGDWIGMTRMEQHHGSSLFLFVLPCDREQCRIKYSICGLHTHGSILVPPYDGLTRPLPS